MARDVSEQRRAEHALKDAEERFRRAFDEAPIGMAIISEDGRLEQANAALAAICGYTRGDLEDMELRALLHPADIQTGIEALRALAAGDIEQVALDLRIIPAAGSAVDLSVHATRLRHGSDHSARLLCQFLDVTDRKRFEERLQFMADHDPLTGLLNRRKFEAELDRHVEHVRRYGPEGAVLVLDLDHFKAVNDTLGHNAGDAADRLDRRRCCASACAPRTSSPDSAATSSPSCCQKPTAPRPPRSQTRSSPRSARTPRCSAVSARRSPRRSGSRCSPPAANSPAARAS